MLVHSNQWRTIKYYATDLQTCSFTHVLSQLQWSRCAQVKGCWRTWDPTPLAHAVPVFFTRIVIHSIARHLDRSCSKTRGTSSSATGRSKAFSTLIPCRKHGRWRIGRGCSTIPVARGTGRFRPNIADCLYNHSYQLADDGYRQEALQATRESVKLRRGLNSPRWMIMPIRWMFVPTPGRAWRRQFANVVVKCSATMSRLTGTVLTI